MRGTTNHKAFNQFVKGVLQFPANAQQAVDRAIKHFTAAIAIDPNFARAHAWLGYAYLTIYYGRWSRPTATSGKTWSEAELIEAVHHHVKLARHLDPYDFSIRWTAMNAHILTAKQRSDPGESYQLGRQELAWADYLHRDEGAPIYLAERMLALAYLGLHGELDAAIEQARPVGPLRSWVPWSIACALYASAAHQNTAGKKQERYVLALEAVDPVVNLDPIPGFVVEAWLLKAMCHARLGQPAEAENAITKFAADYGKTRSGKPPWTLSDEDASVGFARGHDRRHWIEGLAMAIGGKQKLALKVPDPDGLSTSAGLKALEAEDYPTSSVDGVP